MQIDDRLKLIKGYGEYFLYVDSSEIDSDIVYIKMNHTRNVILNAKGDYKYSNLDWLSEVGDQLQRIVVTSPSKGGFNYDGLRFCSNLAKLKINNFTSDFIDVSANVALRELDVFDCRYVTGIENLVAMETLILTKANSKLIEECVFNELKNLRFLSFSNTSLGKSLRFLRNTRLDSLEFNYCRSLSLAGLPDLKIRNLSIQNCKNIDEAELIFQAHSLERLSLVDSIRLRSAKDLSELVNLREIILLGTSYFEDGDLDALKDRFRVCNFDDKKHYNIRFADFKDFLASS